MKTRVAARPPGRDFPVMVPEFGGCSRKVRLPVAARPDHEVVGPPTFCCFLWRILDGEMCHACTGFAGQACERLATLSSSSSFRKHAAFVSAAPTRRWHACPETVQAWHTSLRRSRLCVNEPHQASSSNPAALAPKTRGKTGLLRRFFCGGIAKAGGMQYDSAAGGSRAEVVATSKRVNVANRRGSGPPASPEGGWPRIWRRTC